MSQLSLVAKELKSIEFSVRGYPVCQGSKIALITGKRSGKWVLSPRAVLVESANMEKRTLPANRLKNWRESIAYYAHQAMQGEALWGGQVGLECEFIIPRRPTHYTGKGALTKSAPRIPPNDVDKMLRAVGDALSRVVYEDDNQAVFVSGRKRYASSLKAVGGVKIKVSEL